MKLEQIIIENFRQYHRRQTLSFARDAKRHITIIHGLNGTGKTSLFLAINWCLYGNESIVGVGQITSKEAVKNALVDETIRTSVDLTFSHDGELYRVSRRLGCVRQADGSIEDAPSTDKDFVMSRIRSNGQTERINNPIGRINAILPSNVRTYFLFDGEKIDNFAKPEANDEVRYAIYNVLKLEVLARGQKHLEDVAGEYRQELRKISTGELSALTEREDKARGERKKELARREELDREIESARRKVGEIDQALRELQDARALQARREKVERDLKQRHDEMDDLISLVKKAVMGCFAVVAKPAVEGALAILDEKRERGVIPSNIRQQFVQDLIEQMQCICGRSFELDSPEHHSLLTLMRSTLPGTLEKDITDLNATLLGFGERIQTAKTTLDSHMRRRTELQDIIRGLDEELDDIGRQLESSPQEEIGRLEGQRRAFQADIENYKLEQGTIDARVDSLNKEISQLEKQIDKAKKDETKEAALSRKSGLAQRAADAIETMYQAFAEEMRQSIEARAKEIFQVLIWKDAHFQIRLDSDYNLVVIDRYGYPSRSELSSGERQVLSLSFITALAQVSGEEAPLVIDTPFGRLSSHHRLNITENLPNLTKQLVLFVTDEELRDQSLRNLQPYIGTEYNLNFDQETGCTSIELKRT